MKKVIFILTIIAINVSIFGQNISGTSLSCGVSSSQQLTNSGFSGSNATSTTGSCGQCCYTGSDLDSDGDADVNFSVENSKWYKYCNPSGTTALTIDFIVDETNNDCNLQGAVFVTSGTSASGTTDALDIDCSNQEYAQFGSGVSGNADGFSFTGITIPPGGCAWLMVDGYGGASCGAFTVNTVCPPLCTNPTTFTAGPDQVICEGSSILLNSTVSGGTTTAPGLTYSWSPTTGLSSSTIAGRCVAKKCLFGASNNRDISVEKNELMNITSAFTGQSTGVGMLVQKGADISVENSILGGGSSLIGVLIKQGQRNCVLKNCEISNCAYDGIVIEHDSCPQISDCIISNSGRCGIRFCEGTEKSQSEDPPARAAE